MQLKRKGILLLLGVLATSVTAASAVLSLEDTIAKKPLRSPATVSSVIGGESHDSYVLQARKGQTLTVKISWQHKDDNRTEFTVSESPDFFSAAQVRFGRATESGKHWSGRIPKNGNYYIYVVAHPSAFYTMSVNLK